MGIWGSRFRVFGVCVYGPEFCENRAAKELSTFMLMVRAAVVRRETVGATLLPMVFVY